MDATSCIRTALDFPANIEKGHLQYVTENIQENYDFDCGETHKEELYPVSATVFFWLKQ